MLQAQFTALSFSLVLQVLTQLINKIEAGNFVDMSKLLSDYMGVLDYDDHPKSTKPKCRNFTNIVCAIYLYPELEQLQSVPDPLGYQ